MRHRGETRANSGLRSRRDDQRLREEAREATLWTRMLAEQAFSRTAGAPLVAGNSIRLLKDGRENYPAWLEAIRSAQQTINVEIYIMHADDVGQQFADALIAKAQEGVRVRLLYDWLGGLGKTSSRFWRRLSAGGVEVRCFNPPRIDSPLGWLSRDHRKSICVDQQIAFVTGLCIGRMWADEPQPGLKPWRDTGIEVRGPAVGDIVRAFNQTWAEMGPALPADELPQRDSILPAGDVMLRVVASIPNLAGLYRLDQLIAAVARQTLWLTDAYFVGTTNYVQALRAAAMDGVDVRLLVPGSSDIPLLIALSRAAYRPLLEAGVRVFEWNGSMLHAKTAVADGRWARVGSTNLNIASWVGNWELDVAVEDEAFAHAMQDMYLEDLTQATEMVLSAKQRILPSGSPRPRSAGDRQRSGSTGRVAAGAISVSNTIGAAITNRRVLGPAEAKIMVLASVVLLALAAVAMVWPLVLIIPLTLFAVWMAIALLIKAYRLHRAALSPTEH
jgi:cardiolipin synthase A/B